MNMLQAVLLGIIEGLTEYLPVSSTGHLLLAQRAMGLPEGDAADAYAICIQGGAILAVLGLYAPRLKQMILGVLGRNGDGARLARNLLLAFLPAAVVGVLLGDAIRAHLFGLPPIIAAWLAGGGVILLVARQPRFRSEGGGTDLPALSVQGALLIGAVQCLAMWPGTSRSLVTILAAVLAGLSLAAAVEFSFLLGVLTLVAATLWTALKIGPAMAAAYDWKVLLAGFLVAWLSAVAAVRWMVGYLNRHDLSIFGYWRIGLGLATLVWILYPT
ncbi:MAG: undecaprenyl-diphosphate phosphatase [bacterium]